MASKRTAHLFPELALKERLLIAAERDIALHSLPGSRIQRVVKDAGSANISAIRYHYGDMARLQDAVFFYRYKAINRYADIISQRWSAEVGEHMRLQHYVFAIFAPRCLIIYHTLPAAYYCACAEQLEILKPDRINSQDRYPWFAPLRNAFAGLYSLLSKQLGGDVALERLQLVAPLTAGMLTQRERKLREAFERDELSRADAAAELSRFASGVAESLSASLLREHYEPVDTDFSSVFSDLIAISPEWFLEQT